MRPSNNLENKTPWDNENQTPFMGDGLLRLFKHSGSYRNIMQPQKQLKTMEMSET